MKRATIDRTSVVLIGMPGAGKSTLGVLLAKALALDFVDTDVLIQLREGRTLQQILDAADYLRLRAIEEETILAAEPRRCVVATGGSAVYSRRSMEHLRSFGPIVFLDVPLDELERRITNFASRGIAADPSQSLEALFEERRALYLEHADLRIDVASQRPEKLIDEIVAQVT